MAHDPVRRCQLVVSELLRGKVFDSTRLDDLDDAGRERVYDKGRRQIAALSERIEAQTGFALDDARALDFGCGVGRNALALAQRCEHVYGLDVSPAVLREGARNAEQRGLNNIEWLDAGELSRLRGRYDLIVSFFVFQHIPSREGERIFAELVRGLRAGGVGAVHVTLRPRFRRPGWTYLYALMNSYSLDRLSAILGHNGVSEWHARAHSAAKRDGARSAHRDVTIIFRKDQLS